MFSADNDEVTDRLPDGSTDESNDIWMEGNLPMKFNFGKFHTAILVGIFTMSLAYGWMDRSDDRHTDGWADFQEESHLGQQTDESCD